MYSRRNKLLFKISVFIERATISLSRCNAELCGTTKKFLNFGRSWKILLKIASFL